MNHIIPTVFATSKREFTDRFNKLIKVSKALQIDFMDGKFVRNKSISLSVIPDLKGYNNNFEAHLMVNNPQKWISKLRKKGFKKLIFHYEAVEEDNKAVKLINKIKSLKIKAFIAINPETSINKIKDIINKADGVLLMGVHPGKEHQQFIPSIYNKVKLIRKLNKKIPIQIDGGIDFSIAKKLGRLGVKCINSGSFIFRSANPGETIKRLNSYLVTTHKLSIIKRFK